MDNIRVSLLTWLIVCHDVLRDKLTHLAAEHVQAEVRDTSFRSMDSANEEHHQL